MANHKNTNETLISSLTQVSFHTIYPPIDTSNRDDIVVFNLFDEQDESLLLETKQCLFKHQDFQMLEMNEI